MTYCQEHRPFATPHAMAQRCLMCEILALRKRVEGWEEEARKYASDVTYWRTRAEKAERERDAALESLASYQASAHNYVLKHQENAKLQADLDAALDCCETAAATYDDHVALFTRTPTLAGRWRLARSRVSALLEKRREKRG